MISPVVIVIPLFAALIALEAHLSRIKGSDEFADRKDTAANVALGFGSIIFDTILADKKVSEIRQ